MLKVAVFNTKPYVEQYFRRANERFGHALTFLEPRLTDKTVDLARGFDGVCIFVNDLADAPILARLKELGVRLIACGAQALIMSIWRPPKNWVCRWCVYRLIRRMRWPNIRSV